MFVIVRGQKNVKAFCRYLPRVHAAITLTVDRNLVPVVNGKYQLKDTQRRFLEAINQFLPKPLVIKLHLLPVARIIGKGAVDLELPGTNENCMSILEIPADVLEMLEAENKRINKSASRATKAKKSVSLTLKPASRKSRRKYIPPSVTVEAKKSDIPAEKTPDPGKCKKLNELWSEGFHKVSGRKYWLGQAFTLDDNNDDVVDNVGFLLQSEGRPDVYIYYFPGPGLQSVITVPSLRLANDRDAKMVCAGHNEFNNPEDVSHAPQKTAEASERAKLTGDTNEVLEAGKGGHSSNNGFFEGSGLYFVIAVGVGVLLIAFAGIYFFISKRKSVRRRKHRRQRKNRRRQNRRQRQVSPEGEDKRETEERRAPPERRDEDERRDEAAAEESEGEDKKA